MSAAEILSLESPTLSAVWEEATGAMPDRRRSSGQLSTLRSYHRSRLKDMWEPRAIGRATDYP